MARTVLEGVSKVYPRGVLAVQALDLDVEDGEFLVLVGPSGCGKTTTLRLIAGLEAVTSGEIRIGGRVANRLPPRERDVALVFQSGALFPQLSVARNIAFGLELRSGGGGLWRVWHRLTGPARAAADAARRRAIRQQVRRAAEMLEIEHLLDRLPRQLSGGERQRVALGRALVRQPAVFLLDEPLSNLDAGLRLQLRRELQRLHERLRTTTIYVTHDQAEAMALGGRMAVMDAGRLQQIGEPRAVYDRPRNRFVARFVGSPAMNLLSGRLCDESGRLQFVSRDLTLPLPPWAESVCRAGGGTRAEVELGVRPSDLHLVPPGSAGACGRGRAAWVEWLGDRTLVAVACSGDGQDGSGECRLISQADSRAAVAKGDELGLAIDGERVHLFDGRSGENLIAAAGGGRAAREPRVAAEGD